MAIGESKILVSHANSDITSSEHVVLGDANAVIVELFPTGVNPVAQFQLQDSATATVGFGNALDLAGAQTGLTASTPNKYLVPNLLRFVRIRVTPTSGNWSARVTPVLATDQSPISTTPIGTGTVIDDQATATTVAAALPNHACNDVQLQNDPFSSADVYVGNAASQHTRLQPGMTQSLPVTNTNLLYVKTLAGTATVNLLGMV